MNIELLKEISEKLEEDRKARPTFARNNVSAQLALEAAVANYAATSKETMKRERLMDVIVTAYRILNGEIHFV